jgi:SAM-dependent methyltransferase
LEKRGAAEVVGLDVDSPFDLDFPRLKKLELQRLGTAGLREAGIETIGAGFAVAHAARGSKVKREVCRLYELSPERLGQFDLIFCSEVLEHLRDPQTALENLFSVTKPGGAVLIAEPFNPDLEWFGRTISVFVGTTNNIGVWWEHSTRSLRKMMAVAGFAQIDEAARLQMDNKLGRFSKIVFRAIAPAAPVPERAAASRVSEPTAKEEGLTNAVDA